VKAGVDDDVEDGIDVAVGVHVGDGAVFVSGLRGLYRCWGWCKLMCVSWDIQVCAFKLGCSGRGFL
jgi:hypothetical protein